MAAIVGHANGRRPGVHVANAVNTSALLRRAADLSREGLYTPRVERIFRLGEIAEAHAYSERGRVRAKIGVVI